MIAAVYSPRPGEADALRRFAGDVRIRIVDRRLDLDSVADADGCEAVCATVADRLDQPVLQALQQHGVRLVVLRCVGFNNVNLAAAVAANITVMRVPAYPPHAVAEHTLALILTLARNTHLAWNRTGGGDCTLDGLIGRDLHEATVAVIGTGRIGVRVAAILAAFGCRVLAHDPVRSPQCRAIYKDLESCLAEADIVTLHCPLTPRTVGMIGPSRIARMKRGALLVNTSRSRLLDIPAITMAISDGHLAGLGMDLYEEDEGLYVCEPAERSLRDTALAALLGRPEVLVTVHQAWYTEGALAAIARTTMGNIAEFARNGACVNSLTDEFDSNPGAL